MRYSDSEAMKYVDSDFDNKAADDRHLSRLLSAHPDRVWDVDDLVREATGALRADSTGHVIINAVVMAAAIDRAIVNSVLIVVTPHGTNPEMVRLDPTLPLP